MPIMGIGDFMTLFDNILLETIFILFPLSIWMIYQIYMKNIDKLPSFYIGLIDKWGEDNAVTDYIASMTDTFAVKAFEDLFVPNCWNI